MLRALIGTMIGGLIGLALAGWGAYDGFTAGIPTRRDLVPGVEAAALNALIYTVFLFWLAIPVGVIGGVAGFASSLVAPRDEDA